ncbi:hypothetical protein CYG50_18260 [Providencia huaxiensis]|nr:hypothetical protein CYG50_18260 [Providencia huaxiensis]
MARHISHSGRDCVQLLGSHTCVCSPSYLLWSPTHNANSLEHGSSHFTYWGDCVQLLGSHTCVCSPSYLLLSFSISPNYFLALNWGRVIHVNYLLLVFIWLAIIP